MGTSEPELRGPRIRLELTSGNNDEIGRHIAGVRSAGWGWCGGERESKGNRILWNDKTRASS